MPLSTIPGFYDGYVGARKRNEQTEMNDVRQAANLMQIIGQQQAMQEKRAAMQRDEQMRQVMLQSGGDPDKAISSIIASGGIPPAQLIQAADHVRKQKQAEQFRTMTPEQLQDPDTLDRLGASGLPGTAHFTAAAERLRKRKENEASLGFMRSAPAINPDPQEVAQGADYGTPVPAAVPARAGMFASLMTSKDPAIALAAKNLQDQVNSAPAHIPVDRWESARRDLTIREATAAQANQRQQITIDNRNTEPLETIVGPDGKPQRVPRSEAIGKTPWVGSPDQLALKVTGGRESVYVQRMMMGANQAAKDLANVVQLPLTASTGVFGGRKQGAGLLDATKEVLANKATGQEAQAYNAMATGFQRSLAQIESAGLMPSGSLTHQMDAVLFKEGDTNLTKLHKLAQTRQIVEAGMEVIEDNPRVSPEEKAKIKSVLESVRKSVPFTHSDLIRLQVAQESNPGATLGSILNAGGTAAPKEGQTGTSKSGKPTVFRNGRWEYQ